VCQELVGIGLLIELVRRRAQALGGRFAIDSSPGRGTCVRVELPLSAVPT